MTAERREAAAPSPATRRHASRPSCRGDVARLLRLDTRRRQLVLMQCRRSAENLASKPAGARDIEDLTVAQKSTQPPQQRAGIPITDGRRFGKASAARQRNLAAGVQCPHSASGEVQPHRGEDEVVSAASRRLRPCAAPLVQPSLRNSVPSQAISSRRRTTPLISASAGASAFSSLATTSPLLSRLGLDLLVMHVRLLACLRGSYPACSIGLRGHRLPTIRSRPSERCRPYEPSFLMDAG